MGISNIGNLSIRELGCPRIENRELSTDLQLFIMLDAQVASPSLHLHSCVSLIVDGEVALNFSFVAFTRACTSLHLGAHWDYFITFGICDLMALTVRDIYFCDACRKCSDFVGVLGKRFVGLGNSIVIFRRKDWKIYLAKSSMSVWRRSEQNASNGISLSAGILRIAHGSLRPNYRRCRCPLQSAKLVLRTESLLLGNDTQ